MNGKSKTGFDDDRFAQLTPGQKLAAAREAQGQSIEDVVRHTKLSRRQVMALESDSYDQLPGPVFVRGFMRNYARHLQLDAAPLLAALDARSAPAVIPSGSVVEPPDLGPGAEESASARAPEASNETASDSIRDSNRDSIPDSNRSRIAEPVIEQGRTEQVTAEQGVEPVMREFSDAAAEPARAAQDAPALAPDTFNQPESAADAPTRAAALESNASDRAAADQTKPDDIGASASDESVDSLSGIADTRKAWRNYALVSLAVVIGLLALVIITQT